MGNFYVSDFMEATNYERKEIPTPVLHNEVMMRLGYKVFGGGNKKNKKHENVST